MTPTALPMKPIHLLAVLPVCAGCALGPDYTPPEPPLPATWSLSSGTVGDGTDLSEWWRAFADPRLDSLVQRAVAGNLDLRSAAARVAESRARRTSVAADGLPQVNLAAGYNRVYGSTLALPGGSAVTGAPIAFPFGPRGYDVYQTGFDASWEIDVFGRIRREVEAAEADAQAAGEDLNAVLVSLVSEVGRSYVEARSLQARVRIAEDNIRIQRDSLALARARFQAGLTSELDVQRAEAQLAATVSQVPVLRDQLQQTAHRLGVLLGGFPDAAIPALEPAAPLPNLPPLPATGVPADLLRRRPDIRRAERRLAAATARIGAAVAQLFPRVSVTGTFGGQSSDGGNVLTAGGLFAGVGPAVKVPVLEWGRIRGEIAARDAQTAAALAEYEKTVLTALAEVEDALHSLVLEQERLASLRASAAADRAAVAIAGERYSKGVTDFLSVLDAQRSLYASEDRVVQSERTVLLNLIALYKALGGGWQGGGQKSEG